MQVFEGDEFTPQEKKEVVDYAKKKYVFCVEEMEKDTEGKDTKTVKNMGIPVFPDKPGLFWSFCVLVLFCFVLLGIVHCLVLVHTHTHILSL